MQTAARRFALLAWLAALVPLAAGETTAGHHGIAAGASETPVVADQPVLPPCTCRADGRVFDMGETTCLQTPSGPRLAVCAMDQNVTSWRSTANACPSAGRGGRIL